MAEAGDTFVLAALTPRPPRRVPPRNLRHDLAIALTDLEFAMDWFEDGIAVILAVRSTIRERVGLPANGPLDPWPNLDPASGA